MLVILLLSILIVILLYVAYSLNLESNKRKQFIKKLKVTNKKTVEKLNNHVKKLNEDIIIIKNDSKRFIKNLKETNKETVDK